jgi:lysine-N-methylase
LKGWLRLGKNKNVVEEFLAPKYMTRFHCLGSSCPDTCCGWWNVFVDEPHYRKLRKVMSSPQEKRELFSQAFIPQDGDANQGEETYAAIRMGDDGYCRFLSKDHLCSIHKDFGPDVLPNICTLYPRMISLVGERVELTGELSCPEIARLCLLADDALELVDFNLSILSRQKCFQTFKGCNEDPYTWYFDDIRTTLLKLLCLKGFPMSSRFYFIVDFARKVSPFFNSTMKSIDEGMLAQEINSILNPDVQDELHAHFSTLNITPDPRVMEAVQRVLLSRLQHENCRPGYTSLIIDTFTGYEQEQSGVPFDSSRSNINLTLTPAQILHLYVNRRNIWERSHLEKIELYTQNYSMNYILKDWYTGWPDLNAYVRSLLIRVTAIRFLLFSHPRLYAIARQPNSSAGLEEGSVHGEVDKTAVEMCYNFTRNIGHSPQLNTRIEAILNDLSLISWEGHLPFLRF